MKIEVNIDKRYFLAILGIIFIGIGVYAAVDTSQPYHDATSVRLSDGSSIQEFVDSQTTFSAGEIVIVSSLAEKVVTHGSVAKEVILGRSGSVRIRASARTGGNQFETVYIRRNGITVETLGTAGNSKQSFTKDVSGWSSGDKLQLYVTSSRGSSYWGGFFMYLSDFKISISEEGATLPIASLTIA